MKSDEIKKAYEELDFSEHLKETCYRKIVSGKKEQKKRWKAAVVPAMFCLLAAGTTIYAAEKLNWFQRNYGENYACIRGQVNEKVYSTENGKLKLSVEQAAFTKEKGKVYVHIQALEEESRIFMETYGENLTIDLTLTDAYGEVLAGGSANVTEYDKAYSDAENWYYIVTATNPETNDSRVCEKALLSFPSAYQESCREDTAVLSPMELEFPAEQTIAAKVYRECGEFREVSISPLSITVVWEEKVDRIKGAARVQELEILMKDGTVLQYQKSETPLSSAWYTCFQSVNGENETVMVLEPKALIRIEEIESVTINGVKCQ